MERYIIKLTKKERENLLSLTKIGIHSIIHLNHLSRQCLDRRIPDQETMRNEVLAWTKTRNEDTTIVNWQFTTDDARIKLKRLYLVLSPGGQN